MKKKPLYFLLCLLVFIFLSTLVSMFLSQHALAYVTYSVEVPSLSGAVRIIQLTDLHNSEFGKNNQRLVSKVALQRPDLILITGDLLNYNEQRTDIAQNLISQLSAVAPVYVSYGNHEITYEKNNKVDLRSVYSEAGAIVLDYDWNDITVNNQRIRIGGIFGYCMPGSFLKTGEAWEAECAFLESFQDTENYKVLMCHMPYSWIVQDSLNAWNIDCVLCGHVHGGQVRIPLIGGLWAPDQGWFPGRESGLYWSNDFTKMMVLSRGLGNTDKLPRLNNIPEILVLDLLPG